MKAGTWIVFMSVAVASAGCNGLTRKAEPGGTHETATRDAASKHKLVRIAVEMLDPANKKFNPEKGRNYLEYALKNGVVRDVEVPAAALLELLKSERVAIDKSRNLEQQLEIMKAIDLDELAAGREKMEAL